jgi:hypothetical protein
MAHFLFVDESGYGSSESPYGVLGGIAVEDRELWTVARDIQAAETKHFGIPYSAGKNRELKAKKLLNHKVFRLASQLNALPREERTLLARDCLEKGATAGLRKKQTKKAMQRKAPQSLHCHYKAGLAEVQACCSSPIEKRSSRNRIDRTR